MSTTVLNIAQAEKLCEEIDQLRRELVSQLGAKDARYIRRVVRLARGSAIAGRGLLMFGFEPVSWCLGTLALAFAKIVENMEVGHNVMHGQYDWMNDPSLQSRTYEWDGVSTSDDWRHTHNVVHHDHCNVVELDRDFGYGVLRMSEQVPWRERFKRQLFLALLTSVMFEWAVGVHRAEIDSYRDGEISFKELKERLRPFGAKTRRQVFKDYLLFPALALWHWPRVLLGNIVANLIRNVWAAVVIFCGHFPEQVRSWRVEQIRGETRGQWYARQIEGSCNIEGGRLMYFMSGHLSHQIEHHLLPDIPAWRYPEVAPRVREMCARYGLQYNTGPLLKQYASALSRIMRFRRRQPNDLVLATG